MTTQQMEGYPGLEPLLWKAPMTLISSWPYLSKHNPLTTIIRGFFLCIFLGLVVALGHHSSGHQFSGLGNFH